MTPNNLPPKSNSARLDNLTRLIKNRSAGFFLRAIAVVILAGLAAGSFYSSSSASQLKPTNKNSASEVVQNALPSPPRTLSMAGRILPVSKVAFNPVLMPVPTGGETIATFAGGGSCTTPKTSFVVGDSICVKVTGFPTGSFFPHRLVLGNANSTIIRSFDITTDPQTFEFIIDATSVIGGVTVDNRGSWQAVVINPFFYYPEGASLFTVADPANLTADSGVASTSSPGDVQAGTAITFGLQLKNYGPDSAATVQLTDAVPANTTFVDFQQVSGPTFTCVNPGVGSTGTTTCSLASLDWPGPAAQFVATYMVNPGTAANTAIVNTANVSSTTNDQNIANNSTSDTATVTAVAAGQTCSFNCPGNIVATATSASGAIVTFASAINIDGDCGAISANPASGSQFPVGTTTVNVTSTSGPSCSFTVTVVDTPAPTISCPVDKIATADGSGFATVSVGAPATSPSTGVTVVGRRSDDTPAVYDQDGNLVTPAVIVPLTDPYPIGTTGITWTVTDEFGRTATCTQKIVVHSTCATDTAPPTITAPADINVGTGPNSTTCGVVLDDELGQAVYGDDCSAVLSMTGIPAGNLFPVGTTVVTYTATDGAGHTASDTQTVVVSDNTPPAIAAPADASYTCPENVPAGSPSQAHGTDPNQPNGGPVTDNCGTPTVTVADSSTGAGSTANPRIISRTFTATDSHGNSANAVQTITVTDGTAPTITAPANVSANTGPGATSCDTVVSNATLGTASASDNCAGVTVSRSPSGNTFPVGNTTVTWKATDWAGNTATATQTVTVVDNTVPIVTAPANVTASTGPGATSCGTVVSDATLGTASATDNCPGVGAISRTGVPSGNTFPVGTTTITYSVTDAHGNSASANQTVTVIDNTVPIVTAPANVTASTGLGATSCGTVVSNATLGTATATDNCPGVGAISRTGVPSGNNFPVGTTTVTYSVTDAHGNSASANQTVTVTDNTVPVISCPANIVIEPTCPTGAIATYATPTATDNCAVQSVTRNAGSLASGSVFPIGTSTVTHTATDIYGNQSSCSFTVTVLTPQVVVQNLINSVNASSLTGTQKNGLLAKLNAALTAINGGGGNACAKLSDFVSNVATLISHGDISAAQGNAWINSANHVRNTIGCTNLGCS